MQLKKSFGISAIAFAALMTCLSSCNQQFYRGYGYKGSAGAPDVRNERSADQETETPQSNAFVALPEKHTQIQLDVQTEIVGPEAQSTLKIDPAFQQMVTEEAGKLADEGKDVNHRNLTKNITQRLTEEGLIQPVSPAQERKMTRLAAKMDKKLKKQGKEIDWRHNSNLELFFMIMSIAGLVLGIIGVGIGWFVFIVFAGLWLYFKLVKD